MNSPIYWFMFGCIVVASINASGCGHIDRDLELSDEEIEAKYSDEPSFSGGWGASASYSSHCGGMSSYGYARHRHASLSEARVSGNIEADAPGLNTQRAAGNLYVVARRDRADDAPREDAPAPRKGRRLRTWGDYVAQEMARAARQTPP